MTNDLAFIFKLLSLLGCGLMAGVFFAFSTFVMKALAQLETPQGVAAMQAINIVVINPWFMTAFMGTAATCLVLAIATLLNWQQPTSIYILLGSLLYLIGTFGVTIVGNVPLNNALANVEPTSAEGAALWAQYLTRWTIWNHIRTIAALVATAAFAVALQSPS